jgi:hypothetical protein
MKKTTIAKSFLVLKVAASSQVSDKIQPNGLVHLQEKLMSDILSERNIAITNITEGMDMIKEKLCFKWVLIVIDDVFKW